MSSIRVGFIGLGNMGMAMARCLPKKGLTVTVYDIRKEAIDEMVALGAKAASSCREVAEASDVIITMVRDIDQTRDVIFGKDGVWEGIKEGSVILITSSIGPKYCQEVYAKGKEKGVQVVDCAVSDPSGTAHYLEGQLTLMIGGDEDAVKKCWPIFEAMGKNIFHLGGIGTGQAYKLINNMAVMHTGTLIRECLNLGVKAGLDLDKMVDVLSVSTGGTWALQNQAYMKKKGIKMPPMPRPAAAPGAGAQPQGARRMPFELEMAWQLAEEVGAEMPICKFIDELDTASVYKAYTDAMNKQQARSLGL